MYIVCGHLHNKGLLHAKLGQVVLAGDPKQLGPIVRSPFAVKYGMGMTTPTRTCTVPFLALWLYYLNDDNRFLVSAGVSFLERLMKDCPLYQKKDGMFDNCYVTKLLHNYRSGGWGYCGQLWEEITIYNNSPNVFVFILCRSHPAILKVPNELFYDGELQPCANQMLRESYCNWQHLPKRVMTLHPTRSSFDPDPDFWQNADIWKM